ncbi:MAG: hypothetical protein R2706_18055 [Acidimicrobiales bacterium]
MANLNWYVVLNRADSKVGLADRDIEQTLGHQIDSRIPSTRAVPVSVNQGQPIVLAEPRVAAPRAFVELANRVAGIAVEKPGLLRRRSAK